MKELSIVRFIKEFGLAKAIEKFKLKSKIYENKILLKYDQLESNMSLEEVQDCRGLILERDTWKVMAMSFFKFFNYNEGNAAIIDWNTARILEKLDGSLIQCYYDWHKGKWFASTTGTGEGEGEVNNKTGTTFNDLFWKTISKYNFDTSRLSTEFTYVFELTTPYNIVVKPHGESSVTLLAVRNNVSLEEVSYDNLTWIAESLGVHLVNSYSLNQDVDSLLQTFQSMPWSDEGYVVIDANFNRVKIKNPAYIAVHHLKNKTAEHNILSVVKTNEIDEFASIFPERKDELYELHVKYTNLITKLESVWEILKGLRPKNISSSEKKEYAMNVFDICKKYNVNEFTNLFFNLENGRVTSVKDYMFNFDDKKLYKIL
jgi:T4 RnlA family RNA ligase